MKKLTHLLDTRFVAFAAAAGLFLSGMGLRAGTTTSETTVTEKESALQEWWDGKYMTGNWFGVRDTLADHGVSLKAEYQGVLYGVVAGGVQDGRATWDQQLKFGLTLDLEKMIGINGLSIFTEVRWR